MSIEIIDKLKQKNNGKFKLMDLDDVDYGDGTSAKDKIDSLGASIAMSDNKLYLRNSKGQNIGEGVTITTSTSPTTGEFMYYDSETGNITTESGTLDGFEYIEI